MGLQIILNIGFVYIFASYLNNNKLILTLIVAN